MAEKSLVIVESPTKARKLTHYLGDDFVVEASIGHIRDLPKSGLGVDIENNFEPTYVVGEDKQKIVKKLMSLAKKKTHIYLATDPDREGEAIAWHLRELLSPVNPKADFNRLKFYEITPTAVLNALKDPTQISLSLVDAQQARRVVDRLVGYELSPVLWKKVRRGLSAGRVQSVALRLIVEREKEIIAFKPEEYWEVDTLLNLKLKEQNSKLIVDCSNREKPQWLDQAPKDHLVARVIEVDAKKYEPKAQGEAEKVVQALLESKFEVLAVEKKGRERSSLPPFTTSTLQQAAANRFGFTSKQTMSLAQQLYEEGLITYHRTDAVSLSHQALEMTRGYIKKQFGDKYLPINPRVFANKSKNAQEAHEAIRVTDVNLSSDQIIGLNSRFAANHQKLYDLIWRRFVSSQMTPAAFDQTTITIEANPASGGEEFRILLKSTGSVMKFDGWMRLFQSSEDKILPEVKPEQKLNLSDYFAAQKFTEPPARYNDASLVKELEKRGIGRPSTYASIISVIVERGYVERVSRRFFATPVGITVSDFLVKYFPKIMDYDFTAEMEEDLDRIARAEKPWRGVVGNFYQPFDQTIKEVTKTAERAVIPVEETGEKCPTCGETEGGQIVIRSGRFGKFKSCSRFPECKYAENLVEKLPEMKCPLCGEGEVIVRKSRWGKIFYGCSLYPTCDWASWKKPEPGLKLTKKEWAQMQEERKKRKELRTKNKGSKAKSEGKKTKTKKRKTK